jgi:hypothetical protein
VSSEEADEKLEPEQHQSSAGGATTSYPTLKASACEAEKGGQAVKNIPSRGGGPQFILALTTTNR